MAVFRRHRGARRARSQRALTACDLLYDRVLLFYEVLSVSVEMILTDNDRELCGRPEQHPYQLLTTPAAERRGRQARWLDRSSSAEIRPQFKPQKAHLWSVAKPVPVVGADGCRDWN